MKNFGYLLLTTGFLTAAYATALDVDNVRWELFTVAAAAATLGVVILKRHAGTRARSQEILELNRTELRESIGNVVRDLREVPTGTRLAGAALRDWIDDQLRPDLRRFADARESMVHLFGLQTYADIMSNFAAGERYINRVWSATADGYDGEAQRYLEKATTQFQDAQAQLHAATKSGA
jgi:hypothetical protein